MKYACELCGYVYDEQSGDHRSGVTPGTEFGQLPEHYECPGCGCSKEAFDPVRPAGRLQTQSHARVRLRK